MNTGTSPDMRFIDSLILAYRMGEMRFEEQRIAIIAAVRAATDAISFLSALQNFGIVHTSSLYRLMEKFMASPTFYRSRNAMMLGVRSQGQQAETFLNNPKVLFLAEPLLSSKQLKLFTDTFWSFSRNHQATVMKPGEGPRVGLYAYEPTDNASTLARFQAHLSHLMHHSSPRVKQSFEGFPADIVMAVLQRAYL